MRLDTTSFPIVWMRDHRHGEDHDAAAEQEALLALLARDERFVMIADKLPKLSDMAEETPEQRRERAQVFKRIRGDFARLCAGLILVGDASGLPLPIRKAIEGMTRGLGVATIFARDEAAAVRIAQDRLVA